MNIAAVIVVGVVCTFSLTLDKSSKNELGIRSVDDGEVDELNTAEDLVSVRWSRHAKTRFPSKLDFEFFSVTQTFSQM